MGFNDAEFKWILKLPVFRRLGLIKCNLHSLQFGAITTLLANNLRGFNFGRAGLNTDNFAHLSVGVGCYACIVSHAHSCMYDT